MTAAPDDAACRADLWLWRARFYKTRALAAQACEAGRIRLTRAGGVETRLDKPGRCVRPGDTLVFAHGGRLTAATITALGWRRGPAEEARALYLQATPDPPPRCGEGGPPKAVEGARDDGARESPPA